MNLIRQITRAIFLFIFIVSLTGLGDSYTGLPLGSPTVLQEKGKKVFVFHAPVNDLAVFRELARQAARLKPFGRVEVNISTLADKGFYEIPEGNNFWYEYASYNPTPYKFFPDPKIAPFIPAEFVKKNREMLLAKAKILREFGLEAAFWCYEPNLMPEAFFEAYPQLRGPRVDHPRRGNHPAFAPCIDVKETQDMYANMVAELLKNAPEIHTFFFKTNDAGSGICWSDWQYTGPNGPVHCKNNSMGERVASLMNSFIGGVSGMYWGVSARHITRPLVIAPQLLTREEEAYFLPHVFNASETEGRMDYSDIHGDHRTIDSGAIKKYISMINKAVRLMEGIPETAPEYGFIKNMTKALRIHCSIMRSCGNFGEAQAIRDRNAEKLSDPPHRPDKAPVWNGDPDLLAFNEIMRDELDNSQEMISLLRNSGMDLICHATDPRYEDTFLLGPGLIDQLILKRKIMLKHWTDIERYMTTPFN